MASRSPSPASSPGSLTRWIFRALSAALIATSATQGLAQGNESLAPFITIKQKNLVDSYIEADLSAKVCKRVTMPTNNMVGILLVMGMEGIPMKETNQYIIKEIFLREGKFLAMGQEQACKFALSLYGPVGEKIKGLIKVNP